MKTQAKGNFVIGRRADGTIAFDYWEGPELTATVEGLSVQDARIMILGLEAAINDEVRICTDCGLPTDDGSYLCADCGTTREIERLVDPIEEPTPVDRADLCPDCRAALDDNNMCLTCLNVGRCPDCCGRVEWDEEISDYRHTWEETQSCFLAQ